MKVYHQPVELIIETSGSQNALAKSKSGSNLKKQLSEAGIPVAKMRKAETATPKTPNTKALASAAVPEKLYIKTGIQDAEMNPWDVAHESAKALGAQTTFVEPNLLQEFVTDRNLDVPFKKGLPGAKNESVSGYDPDWLPHKNTIWHLNDNFSQLKSARDAVLPVNQIIRIGHLDTGYSTTHPVITDTIKKNPLQRNFVEGEPVNDAHDPLIGGKLRQPGHGTGTLGILAGTRIRVNTDDGVFNDFLGGAPFAETICCRIASSVVLMKTTAFADALSYLTRLSLSGKQVHVVSMSMGGAPTKAWADAVNAAYEAGITIVTASGNNFNGLPTQHVVYPARFGRVIAACGVTYDYAPYHHHKMGEMQGCYGPARHMTKALAAFTPNTPWASVTSGKISFAGAGTSSATPQIAAAAAIYYRKYYDELNALAPWQRVEAVRTALYRTALKTVRRFNGSYSECFGNGILQAHDALAIPVTKPVRKMPEDTVPLFPVLNTIFKALPNRQSKKLLMFNTELAQLVYQYPELALLIDNEKTAYEKISARKWKRFAEAVIEHPATSITLKKHLMTTHTSR